MPTRRSPRPPRRGSAGARSVAALATVAMVVAGCRGPEPIAEGDLVVGFVLVGSSDDLGYNQAIAEGAQALARRMPNLRVVVVEDVPEDEAAVDALERLIDEEGATLLFGTSFGHRDAARAVAADHPDVTVVQQSNVEGEPPLDNFGTYFGAHHELFYEAGITAGAATTSGRLGFVASFPISAIRRNVGAFLLGARTVRPDVVVDVRLTGSWCDPAAQRAAATALLDAGADVLAQQQDCTATVLEVARDAGAYAVGYHADGSEVAGDAWLTAAAWDWADTYEEITRSVLDGTFVDSPWNGDWRGSIAAAGFPMVRVAFGPSVTPATEALVAAAHERFTAGEPVFVGPLTGTDGVQHLAAGASLTVAELDELDWVPEGVLGDLG